MYKLRQKTDKMHRSVWMVDGHFLDLRLEKAYNDKDWEASFSVDDTIYHYDTKISSVKIVLSAFKEFQEMLCHQDLENKVILIDPMVPEHSYNFFIKIGFKPLRTFGWYTCEGMLYYVNIIK